MPTSEYTYDPVRRRYIKPNGKVVTPAEQRRIGIAIVDESAEALEALTQSYVKGTITFEEWAVAMREGVKATHSAMSQLAFGGKEMMGARQRGLLGSVIREQYAFLTRFVLNAESGQVPKGDEMISRAKMYGEAGWSTYTTSIGQREKHAGAQQERSFLEPDAEHCDECFLEASKDWQPIGTLIPVGDRTCLSRCQCEFEYREGPPEAEAEAAGE